MRDRIENARAETRFATRAKRNEARAGSRSRGGGFSSTMRDERYAKTAPFERHRARSRSSRSFPHHRRSSFSPPTIERARAHIPGCLLQYRLFFAPPEDESFAMTSAAIAPAAARGAHVGTPISSSFSRIPSIGDLSGPDPADFFALSASFSPWRPPWQPPSPPSPPSPPWPSSRRRLASPPPLSRRRFSPPSPPSPSRRLPSPRGFLRRGGVGPGLLLRQRLRLRLALGGVRPGLGLRLRPLDLGGVRGALRLLRLPRLLLGVGRRRRRRLRRLLVRLRGGADRGHESVRLDRVGGELEPAAGLARDLRRARADGGGRGGFVRVLRAAVAGEAVLAHLDPLLEHRHLVLRGHLERGLG